MRVALAVDIGDERVGSVVDAAGEWASLSGSVVDLITADGGRYMFDYVADPNVRRVLAVEADRARAKDAVRLEALSNRLPEAVRGETRVISGKVVEAVVEAGKGYDAVLVGTHGRTGLLRFFLGSVAEAIVRRSLVPVVVLRAASAPR
ncbi:MAG: nucleotide-binding universal stress UspA family protein [Myxococcota bacterium]|jgi:nucleotide-binding universal stress UspA family protein